MKKHQWSNDELSALCLKLALFLHAGIGASSGLILLAEEEPDAELRALFQSMTRRMEEEYLSLGAAFRAAEQFPAYACGLIEVGERTGRLEEALNALASHYERRAQMERYLRSALLYPAVLLLVMLAVIVVLLTQVLPVFDNVYASLGGQLTGVAGGLLTLGRALDAAMPLLLVLLVLTVLGLGMFAGVESVRAKVLAFWQKHRGDKGVAGELSRARFAQTLAMGLQSGLSGEECLSMAAELLRDHPAMANRCKNAAALLAENVPLAAAITQTGLLAAGDCRLLELGMRSGCQDTVIEQIAERLTEESEAALAHRIGQIEPALVLIASVLVGIILLSVMLPLMNIMAAIG